MITPLLRYIPYLEEANAEPPQGHTSQRIFDIFGISTFSGFFLSLEKQLQIKCKSNEVRNDEANVGKKLTGYCSGENDVKYVSPLKPSHGRSAVELPTDPKAIVEELAKQEFLLSHLHDEIKSGISDPQKEEQLWDVQRLVTQLKRELKALKRRNDSAFVDFDHEPGPCLEMFEEKHLIAVQMELRSKIESEQGAIDQLLCQINELKQCPLSLSVYADPETVRSIINKDDGFVFTFIGAQVSLTPNEEKIWAEKYEELENQKHILTERIISERQKCVSLLAQMEMLSLANQNRKSSSYIGGLQY
ncbi:hypothetical protein M513_00473 [Trichuris suis]|uniref:RalA-binding protein 1-like Ral binding domain-containing protein n=1 Tax=Trichuris suis TaxID=68888 RepID=A0A085MNI4_9BILA|nr:hypothetical protein M513_00473 [Trichuris suis]